MVACKIELARKTGEVVCKTEVPSPRQLERFRCMLQHENLVKGPLDMDAEDSGDSESDSTLQLPGAEENVENEFHDRLPETLVRNRADADAQKNVKTSDGSLLTLGGIPDDLVDYAKAVDASQVAHGCFEEFNQTVARYQERFKEKTEALIESSEPTDIYQIAKETGNFDIRGKIGQQFQREHRKGTEKWRHYKTLSPELKLGYRRNWGKDKHKKYERRETHNELTKKCKTVKKIWGTFGFHVERLGGWGWEPAVNGAKKLCSRAALCGPDWCKKDKWSDMGIFACTEESEADVFEEVWGTFLKKINTDGCRTETTNEDVKDTQEIEEASFQTPKRRRNAVESAGGKGKKQKAITPEKNEDRTMVMRRISSKRSCKSKVRVAQESQHC